MEATLTTNNIQARPVQFCHPIPSPFPTLEGSNLPLWELLLSCCDGAVVLLVPPSAPAAFPGRRRVRVGHGRDDGPLHPAGEGLQEARAQPEARGAAPVLQEAREGAQPRQLRRLRGRGRPHLLRPLPGLLPLLLSRSTARGGRHTHGGWVGRWGDGKS